MKRGKVMETKKLLKLKDFSHPWLDKVIFNLKEKMIIIEEKPDKEGDIILLCLKPYHFNKKRCSFHSGIKNKKDQHRYFFNEPTNIIDTPFDEILKMSLQPLMSSLPIKE
jgi:hypothetical protein